MSEEEGTAAVWAIVELFGHTKIAGRISEAACYGGVFLRVDVPETETGPAFTRFYGAPAVFSVTPMAEELVRQAAIALHVQPLTVYIGIGLPSPRLLPAVRNTYEMFDDDEEEMG